MKKQFKANTVEEDKKLAAAEFGVDISKLIVTVVEEEKKGFLGIGRSDAKIVAEYEPSKAEIAADYIKEILKCMNIDAELDITENEDGAVIDIKGDTTGAVIGRRGETLDAIQQLTGDMPLVLHGGTGIPADMIKKAIDLGVSKINVNTECQLAFADATRKYIEAGKDLEGKGFDPRKLLAPGAEAIKATVKEKMELFGSVGKAE